MPQNKTPKTLWNSCMITPYKMKAFFIVPFIKIEAKFELENNQASNPAIMCYLCAHYFCILDQLPKPFSGN